MHTVTVNIDALIESVASAICEASGDDPTGTHLVHRDEWIRVPNWHKHTGAARDALIIGGIEIT